MALGIGDVAPAELKKAQEVAHKNTVQIYSIFG
jgi:hypothetical protein